MCESCGVSSAVDLAVGHDDVVLAGSLWTPPGSPKTAVVMHPGSGPSDRHNDIYFPPIRTMLLDDGHAVASFDKRGVGGSTGLHVTSSIEQQAGDLLRCVTAVRDQLRAPSSSARSVTARADGWSTKQQGVAVGPTSSWRTPALPSHLPSRNNTP